MPLRPSLWKSAAICASWQSGSNGFSLQFNSKRRKSNCDMVAAGMKPLTIVDRAKQILDSKLGIFVLCLTFALGMLNHRVVPINALLSDEDGRVGQDSYQMVWDLWEVNEAISHGQNPYRTNLIYFPLGAELGRHS